MKQNEKGGAGHKRSLYDLSITLDTDAGTPLYEQIYLHIRNEIRQGKLSKGSRLPSTRYLAGYLQISRTTVDLAYSQLVSEGYIESSPYRGYYVCGQEELYHLEPAERITPVRTSASEKTLFCDFSPAGVDLTHFPHATWRKLSREILTGEDQTFLQLGDPQGEPELRETIAGYLYQARGMNVSPDRIVIGAGNDFLLLLLVTMLGTGLTYAMESPTYLKACELLRSFSGRIAEIPNDSAGMLADALKESGADIAYVMPSHQFPLGTVMPVGRRMRLLEWAAEKADRYIIEDDYDSEFRYRGKPIPALQGMDMCDKVIYLGTFSKSIAPAIRISYLVLPEQLTELYRQRGRRISSTVSRMDQMVLCEFIRGGYFERHLNRMRSVYKNRHDLLLEELRDFREILRISGENAGSHILLTFQNGMTEEEAVRRAAEAGVGVYGLSRYLISRKEDTGTVLLGYATVQENQIHDAVQLLRGAWGLKFHENETN